MPLPASRLFFLYIPIAVVAIALRLWSAMGDFWIDEIWSLNNLRIALQSGSAMDVAGLFFHANTHGLNTLYMSVVASLSGPDAIDYTYRGLSVAAGISSVFMAARIGNRQNTTGGLIAALIIGLSYPLVHYAGEARGYSLMIFAALSCFHLMSRYLKAPSLVIAVSFVAVSILGLASHLTFVVMQAGLGFWALGEIYQRNRSIISAAAKLVPLFGIQIITLVAYGTVAMDNMVRGGDCCPELALSSIGIMAGAALGFDAFAYDTSGLLILVALACVAAIARLVMQGDRSWILYGVVIMVFPLAAWLMESKPDVIHRYFLISAVLMLMLLARMVTALWHSGGWRQWLAGLMLVLFVAGNSSLFMKFSDGGRGQYKAVLSHILENSQATQRITYFPTFSVGATLEYHRRALKQADRLRLLPKAREGMVPADWYIDGYLYGKPPRTVITRTIEGYGEATYGLSRTFPQWGLSGDTYALYRFEP